MAKKNILFRCVISVFRFFTFERFANYGKGSSIMKPSVFYSKKNISIGSNTDIGAFVHIWGHGGVIIGDRVLIASHVAITTLTHDYTQTSIKYAPIISKRVKINNDVWIGSHAVILPGVELGEGCVVGAGAVVTKDVPALAVVMGVPARIVKYRRINQK